MPTTRPVFDDTVTVFFFFFSDFDLSLIFIALKEARRDKMKLKRRTKVPETFLSILTRQKSKMSSLSYWLMEKGDFLLVGNYRARVMFHKARAIRHKSEGRGLDSRQGLRFFFASACDHSFPYKG